MELGAFGCLWVERCMGHVGGNKLPTLRALLEGLFSWFIIQQESMTKNWPKQRRLKMVRDSRVNFIKLFDTLDIVNWSK